MFEREKIPVPAATGYGHNSISTQKDSNGLCTSGQAAFSPLLLDAQSAAKALSIGQRKLWELTNRKEIACVRIGKRVLYDPADLRAFIERQKAVRP